MCLYFLFLYPLSIYICIKPMHQTRVVNYLMSLSISCLCSKPHIAPHVGDDNWPCDAHHTGCRQLCVCRECLALPASRPWCSAGTELHLQGSLLFNLSFVSEGRDLKEMCPGPMRTPCQWDCGVKNISQGCRVFGNWNRALTSEMKLSMLNI